MKTVSEESAPAAEFEQHLDTPNSMGEAMETGFLPDDEHYRLTGEFKKPASEKPEESAPSKPLEKPDASAAATEQPEQEQDDPSKAAASGTAPSQQTQGRESRWQKRERELKEARAEVARLKAAQTSEQPRRETSQATTQPATEAKAAPEPQIDDVDPKTGKALYASHKEWMSAHSKWNRQEAVREFREENAKTQQLTAQQQAEREIGENLTKKFEPLRAKYADFDKVALNDIDPATNKPKYPDSPVLFIPAKSVTDDFIVRSPHGGEVLYYLGQHPEITQGFYGRTQAGQPINLIHPLDQTRKLMEIEAQFSGTAVTADKSSSSSAKPVTQASRPPHQVSGTGAVTKDAVEQAVEDGDTETYMRAQNAKELARLKKK